MERVRLLRARRPTRSSGVLPAARSRGRRAGVR